MRFLNSGRPRPDHAASRQDRRQDRRRKPALSAGSEQDGGDHRRDRRPPRHRARGRGALGLARRAAGLADRSGQTARRRRQGPDGGKGGAGPARALRALVLLRIFVALLRRLRRGDVVLTVTAPFMLPYAVVAAGTLKGVLRVDHARSVFRRAGDGGSPEAALGRGGRDARRQQPDVPRAQCRRHHRPRRQATAARLFRYDAEQIPLHPELGDAGARGAARRHRTIRSARRSPPASSSACRAISASPTIRRSCSRRRAC